MQLQKKEEKNYLLMLQTFLETSNFYFAYDYDLTQSAQRQAQFSAEMRALPLWQRADTRFFWNQYFMKHFIAAQVHNWIMPVVDGFIKIVSDTVNDQSFSYVFISRRSCARTGARYHTRGADPSGNVANFVETEQMIESRQLISSFIQVY